MPIACLNQASSFPFHSPPGFSMAAMCFRKGSNLQFTNIRVGQTKAESLGMFASADQTRCYLVTCRHLPLGASMAWDELQGPNDDRLSHNCRPTWNGSECAASNSSDCVPGKSPVWVNVLIHHRIPKRNHGFCRAIPHHWDHRKGGVEY